MRMTAQEEAERDEYIGEKYNSIFDQQMKRAKANLIKNLGEDNQALLNREFDMAANRIKFDVAWQIFDEVNETNDTLRHIDLSCLDHVDAI